MEYKISVNDRVVTYSKKDNEVKINNNTIEQNFKWIKKGELAYLNVNNKSYRISVLKFDKESKSATLEINGIKMSLSLSDPMDELLKNLGFDKLMNKGAGEVKAPMPGLVLKVLVESGKEVHKGDSLIILEAMKMENVIKSPIDGTVKAIHVTDKQAIEKNRVMIELTAKS
ncbi:MAG: biotin/lipoyl-binding protein [Bacteroidetes bacterium]|nr:biotin/lipoyl-binding protein [Bacteroidota bacterium]